MQARRQLKTEIVRQWLAKAEQDYRAMKLIILHEPSLSSLAAFHAQQAAEKFLKAFLVQHQIEFPKTHDIRRLLMLVAEADKVLSESLREAVTLTVYGVDVRYPGDLPEADRKDVERAAKLAQQVRRAVRRSLSS